MTVPSPADLERLAVRVVDAIASDRTDVSDPAYWSMICQTNGKRLHEAAEAFCAIAYAENPQSEEALVSMAAAFTKGWWILDARRK